MKENLRITGGSESFHFVVADNGEIISGQSEVSITTEINIFSKAGVTLPMQARWTVQRGGVKQVRDALLNSGIDQIEYQLDDDRSLSYTQFAKGKFLYVDVFLPDTYFDNVKEQFSKLLSAENLQCAINVSVRLADGLFETGETSQPQPQPTLHQFINDEVPSIDSAVNFAFSGKPICT